MQDSKKSSGGSGGPSHEDREALFAQAFNESSGAQSKEVSKTPFFEGSFLKESKVAKERVKSSLRMKYEAEVASIRKSCGGLEQIRQKLGLSKRKMAQLLLVDPSAWTRWVNDQNKGGVGAPPHIYRALQWYLLLQDKHPEYRSSVWLNSVATPQLSAHEIKNIERELLGRVGRQLLSQSQSETVRPEQMKLSSELYRSKKHISGLEQKIQWLVYGQIFLIICFVATLLFI